MSLFISTAIAHQASEANVQQKIDMVTEAVAQVFERNALFEKFVALASSYHLEDSRDDSSLFFLKIIWLIMLTGEFGSKNLVTEVQNSSKTMTTFVLTLGLSFHDLVEIFKRCDHTERDLQKLSDIENFIKALKPEQRRQLKMYLTTPKPVEWKSINVIRAHEVIYGERKTLTPMAIRTITFIFNACLILFFMKRLNDNLRPQAELLNDVQISSDLKTVTIGSFLGWLAINAIKDFLCTGGEDEKSAIMERIKALLDETEQIVGEAPLPAKSEVP